MQGYPFKRKNRGGKRVPSGTEGKGLPEVQPGQLPHTACLCQKMLSEQDFYAQWPEPEVGRRHHVLTYR